MPRSTQQCEAMRAETKKRILHESMLYFARNGFRGTRISDLSQGIGIGQGTLYQYFESKEALFDEVRASICNDREIRELKKLAKLPLTARRKIHLLTEWVHDRLEGDTHFAASVVLNATMLLEQGSECSDCEAMYRSDLYDYTARIVRQGQREGSVVAGDPLKLADYYWGVAYLYALKRLFTSRYEMIGVEDMERTLLR